MSNKDWITYHDEEGNECFLNTATGEIDMGVDINFKMRTGGRYFVLSPEQVKNKSKDKNKHPKRHKGEKFYFMSKDIEYDLIPSDLFKLVYLNSFGRFKDDIITKNERQPMTVKDLPTVLNISDRSIRDFLKNVTPDYLIIDDDGIIHVKKECFCTGKIKGKHWLKVYDSGIKKLFQENTRQSQKEIGYILLMIQFLNYEYNVLCHNSHETDMDKIKFMTVQEFCKEIGYDTGKYKRLIDTYGHITIEVDGKKQKFCSFVIEDSDLRKAKIFVNPNVLYSGSHKSDVEILGAFCK